jgi:tRNA threonylcarbamoyl adenosine modification protein (Sua5/YciO/YrdC/YwlC family)
MAVLSDDIRDCVHQLTTGGLVAFPTETVYGLGANALNAAAIADIFKAKKRPLSDPVIVHVASFEQALPLTAETDPELLRTFATLAQTYWPGPLTIVLRKAPSLPDILTAGSEYVGLRSPAHALARELIELCGFPIAAPSANVFSHVSPTSAAHVLKDFHDSLYAIKVLDGGSCSFGIESTVLKLYRVTGVLTAQILRRGGVSEQALKETLGEIPVTALDKTHYVAEDQAAEGPGQLLKHYSPTLDTYIVSCTPAPSTSYLCSIQSCAAIDFGGRLNAAGFQHYRDLSPRADIEEAIHNLYDALRWTEDTGASCVVVTEIKGHTDQHEAALWDRLYRAASGRFVVVVGDEVHKA